MARQRATKERLDRAAQELSPLALIRGLQLIAEEHRGAKRALLWEAAERMMQIQGPVRRTGCDCG